MTNNNENLKPRPPIVVVMGHVDHGKTTLLDYLRKTSYHARAASSAHLVGETGEPRPVAGREAGGITQSIGAYQITHNSKLITFIDTPGHEAFIKMRTRGAHAADLAILVVAADEGVKPQTKESAKILEETKTPFVVAITKTDKANADIEKTKQDLTANGILLEGYGGSISFETISAKTGAGVSKLLDLILITAELEELSYDPTAPASGYILEAKMDKRRGLEASVIVKNGTLHFGDQIGTASARGKIKILEDFMGAPVKSLEPCSPALIIGFETLPAVGEEFSAHPDAASLPAMKDAAKKEFAAPNESAVNVVLKASDAGSLEALSEIFRAMTLPAPLHILSESVGDVVDNDVKRAIPTRAIIFAFGGKTDKAAKTLAEGNRIRIVASDIIYELTKTLEEIAKGGGDDSLGTLQILAVFNDKKLEKQVVGGKVTRGVCRNRTAFIILRPSTDSGQAAAKAGRGKLTNLQQGKEEINEVREGNEAGLMVQADTPVLVGDELVFEK